MEFDKSIGTGYWNVEDATYLDDVAFSLLCNHIKNKKGRYINQRFFRNYKDGYPYNEYYKKAEILIRQEKLKKIKSSI